MKAEDAVRAANQRFYSALESLDLDAMDALWLHEDWVACVHPGWELVESWEAVRASWASIFDNTKRMKVAVTDVTVHVEGDAAWVNCVEQVTSSFETGFSTGWVQATNVFLRRAGTWRMVHHHASPIPQQEEETVQ
ncbi:MAG: nuclear transport factor 2 family protein [Terriglobia bacterium]